ncbi:MAG: hypothetical protein DYH13_08965 [Alphaproteobacteria bacterium PRO2]|nr:hypothetical protein [Alphaproteobacteria bacterium PRO2]
MCLAAFPAWAQNDAAPSDKQMLQETLKNAPAHNPAPALDPYADLPEDYIQEAQKYYALCESDASLYLYYNCKCLGSKFLDKRIELGPEATYTAVVLDIRGECADASRAAGYEYEQCVNNGAMMPYNIPVEEYCACYANTFAKLYEQNSYDGPGARVFTHFQAQAYLTCKNPALAAKFYPTKAK